jgi:uncharacterized membrane protein
MLAPAVAFSDFILAVHILGVVIGFGVVFAYPVLFAVAARTDPSVTPWLLRARKQIGRYVVNPGLLVVLLAGIYLASDRHLWSSFFVGWGIAAVVAIGAIEGSFIMPRSGKLATIAERDLAASAVAAGGQRTSAKWSPEYAAAAQQLSRAAAALQVIVVVTVFIMATRLGA